MSTENILSSFGTNLNIVVIGASGGIGSAFVNMLSDMVRVNHIYAFSRRANPLAGPKITKGHIDLTDETTIAAAAEKAGQAGKVDLVIVTSGLLHDKQGLMPERRLPDLDMKAFEKAFAINAAGPAMVAKHFLPLLNRDKKTAFAALSARVGSISDNHLGGWYAYRASKAALNMLIRTTSIEVARRYKQAIIVGLHPGTVDTSLSKPFQGGVKPEKLFTTAYSAECLLSVLDGLTAEDTGKVFAWDGQEVPA